MQISRDMASYSSLIFSILLCNLQLLSQILISVSSTQQEHQALFGFLLLVLQFGICMQVDSQAEYKTSYLNPFSQCGRPRFDPWIGKIPWRRGRIPTPVFWPGEFHGLYSLWGSRQLDMTDRAIFTFTSLSFSQGSLSCIAYNLISENSCLMCFVQVLIYLLFYLFVRRTIPIAVTYSQVELKPRAVFISVCLCNEAMHVLFVPSYR